MVPVLHWLAQRQLPPLPHEVFVQHRMSSGVPGQALEIDVPPAAEHLAVEMHTPGALLAPVQGPSTVARLSMIEAWTVLMPTKAATEMMVE